jgi:hypothetical protein
VSQAHRWTPALTPQQRFGAVSTRQCDKLPPGVDIGTAGTAIGSGNACFLSSEG